MQYYVYIGTLEEQIVYIGMGQGTRFQHLYSGVSKIYPANKAHFEGKTIRSKIAKRFSNRKEALAEEKRLIQLYRPIWNVLYNKDYTTREDRSVRTSTNVGCIGAKTANATSKYMGVSKSGSKWTAYCKNKGVKKHIGKFHEEIDAAKARDRYILLHDIPYPLNFID